MQIPSPTRPARVIWLLPLALGCGGGEQPLGELSKARRSPILRAPAAMEGGKHVLFGDLHVHTTYSMDAFFTAMPILGGEGAHPPADACDFARHCAALDFFSITDHAMELTPAHWAAEKETVRQCNAVAGDPTDPDLVAFHGFEWTQIGRTAETHYGHKNVIFKGLAEDEVPLRPITSLGAENVNPWHELAGGMRIMGLLDPFHWRDYADFTWMVDRLAEVPRCERDVDTRELPADCVEEAPTPDVLFRKLDEWGLPALVIPHGNAWGSYTPPITSWDKQLAPGMHDPKWQRLVEVMSGHGNSERYASWREYDFDANGEPVCPGPTPDYLPCCWRAGEIMRERCGDLPEAECEARVARARRLAMEAGTAPGGVFPGTGAEDWLDCGQARNGFKPAYGLRPLGSVQYALSLSREGALHDEARRFRLGFVASSDNHSARPGNGFKQTGRKRGRTDMVGARDAIYARLLDRRGDPDDPQQPVPSTGGAASALTIERSASFLYPGGLVAVHARGRSREAIWDALERRETYGTSGPRILLWFDFMDRAGAAMPMGSEVEVSETPRFRVRAVGSFVQKPGCPEDAVGALSAERVERLCLGECYHPGDRRHRIDRIEVVRVRPQRSEDEDVTPLIEDPWRSFPCPPDPEGCRVGFEDPGFERDAVYYVRALQEPTPALNGANLRTRFDAAGRAVAVEPCFVGAAEAAGDDCLADVQERAWSSPIFVDLRR